MGTEVIEYFNYLRPQSIILDKSENYTIHMFTMARIARTVVPGIPHHIVQRGNRNQNVFFSNSDRFRYLYNLRKISNEYGVAFLSYCLMDNHVHLIAIPEKNDSFSLCFRKAHSIYSRHINSQFDWRGHLWQNRFHSSPLGPSYLYNAIRYVEQNPVRAGMVRNAWDYRWSSAGFHVEIVLSDPLVQLDSNLYSIVDDWRAYLSINPDTLHLLELRKAAKRNRPVGEKQFMKEMNDRFGIPLIARKPGRRNEEIEKGRR